MTTSRRVPDGAGRVSVDATPDGFVLTCAVGEKLTLFEIPPDGTALELAACLFFVAMLQDGVHNIEHLTERFERLLHEKSTAYGRAQAIKRGPTH